MALILVKDKYTLKDILPSFQQSLTFLFTFEPDNKGKFSARQKIRIWKLDVVNQRLMISIIIDI